MKRSAELIDANSSLHKVAFLVADCGPGILSPSQGLWSDTSAINMRSTDHSVKLFILHCLSNLNPPETPKSVTKGKLGLTPGPVKSKSKYLSKSEELAEGCQRNCSPRTWRATCARLCGGPVGLSRLSNATKLTTRQGCISQEKTRG